MANIVITTDLQSMLINFGVYGNTTYPANGQPIPLTAAFDKDYVKTFEKMVMSDNTQAVCVNTNDSRKYYLTYDAGNVNANVFIVDNVEGVVPTSLDMLLNLLSQTKYITYLSANISTATTTTVKSGWGVLHAINITSTVISSNIKVYDGPAVNNVLIAEIPFGVTLLSNQVAFILDVRFMTSLVIVTTGTAKIQVSYK